MSCSSLKEVLTGSHLEDIENALKFFSDSLKESFETARGDIILEFESQTRFLCSREHALIRELEINYRQNLLWIERLMGLLELAKDYDAFDRKRIIKCIQSRLHTKLESDKEHTLCSKVSFKCKKLSLEQNIARHGRLEYQVDALGFESKVKSDIENFSHWLDSSAMGKGCGGSFEKSGHHPRLRSVSSGKTDLESFEILESPCLCDQSYGFSMSDKSEEPQTGTLLSSSSSVVPSPNAFQWLSNRRPLSSDLGRDDQILPPLIADPKFWLSAKKADDECTLKGTNCEDLEAKMEALLLKQGKKKLAEDIESTALVRCQPANGEHLCKRLGGCAFQLASDALKMSTKPLVKSWLAQHSFPFEKPQNVLVVNQPTPCVPEPSVMIGHLRKVGESDPTLWLPSKCSGELVSSETAETIILLGNSQGLDGNWKEKWLQKRREPMVCDPIDIHPAKKPNLANCLLDCQGNLGAYPDGSLFSSKSVNWLQSSCKPGNAANILAGAYFHGITTTVDSNAQ